MEKDDARSLFLGIEIVFRSVYPKVITAGYDVSLGVKIIGEDELIEMCGG